MKRAMTIATAGVAAVLMTLTLSVSAQQIDTHDRTFMTFSAPVELPGVTLQPGTYVFRLADTGGGTRNVIQVLSKDEMEVIGHWLFVPAERQDVTGETVVTFKETKEGTTPAVQYWYYPGEKIGKEFLYPKDQALRIAARTGATVKTEEGDVTAPSASASAGDSSATAESTTASAGSSASPDNAVNGSGLPAEQRPESTTASASAQVESQPAPAAATEPNRDNTAVGTAGAQTPSATDRSSQPESTSAANELPRTASPLPLSGLLGLFSLAGAAGLRRFREL
jgi:hypothetical protein